MQIILTVAILAFFPRGARLEDAIAAPVVEVKKAEIVAAEVVPAVAENEKTKRAEENCLDCVVGQDNVQTRNMLVTLENDQKKRSEKENDPAAAPTLTLKVAETPENVQAKRSEKPCVQCTSANEKVETPKAEAVEQEKKKRSEIEKSDDEKSQLQKLLEVPGEAGDKSKRYIRNGRRGRGRLQVSTSPPDEYEYEDEDETTIRPPFRATPSHPAAFDPKLIPTNEPKGEEANDEPTPRSSKDDTYSKSDTVPNSHNIPQFVPLSLPAMLSEDKTPSAPYNGPEPDFPFGSIHMSLFPPGDGIPELIRDHSPKPLGLGVVPSQQDFMPPSQISIKKIILPDFLGGDAPIRDKEEPTIIFKSSKSFSPYGPVSDFQSPFSSTDDFSDFPLFGHGGSPFLSHLSELFEDDDPPTTTSTTTTTEKSASSEESSEKEDPDKEKLRCFTIPDIFHGTKKMFKRVSKGKDFTDGLKAVGKTMKKAAKRVGSCAHKVFKGLTNFIGLTKRSIPANEGPAPEMVQKDVDEKKRGIVTEVKKGIDTVKSWFSKRSANNDNEQNQRSKRSTTPSKQSNRLRFPLIKRRRRELQN